MLTIQTAVVDSSLEAPGRRRLYLYSLLVHSYLLFHSCCYHEQCLGKHSCISSTISIAILIWYLLLLWGRKLVFFFPKLNHHYNVHFLLHFRTVLFGRQLKYVLTLWRATLQPDMNVYAISNFLTSSLVLDISFGMKLFTNKFSLGIFVLYLKHINDIANNTGDCTNLCEKCGFFLQAKQIYSTGHWLRG